MSGHGSPIEKDLSPGEFSRFQEYIREHSGIHLEESRMDPLRISLVTRATRFGFTSFEEYFSLLTTDEGEFRELMSLITVNETSFFRFPAQFDALRTAVVPEILDARSSAVRSFRVWSAGCSTGEEAYTIAMTLLDAGIESLGHHAEVLGTDVSMSALDRAKCGVYPPRALLNVPRDVVTRYFEPTAAGHRVVEQVRNVTTFRYQNLVKEPYPTALMGGWDVIFCRNVTIYFRLDSTRRVVDKLFDSLNPGGYLFVGHSETLTGISDRFETVEVGGVFLHRKPVVTRHLPVSGAATGGPRERVERETSGAAGPDTDTMRLESDLPAPDVAPVPPERPLEAALAAFEAGQRREALALALQASAAQPDFAEAYLLAARIYADDGDFERAYESAQGALAVDPLLAGARYLLGLIHLRSDRAEDAIAEFRRTVYIDDAFALAHLNLGNLHRSRGEYADACRAYERALGALERAPEGPWSAFLGGFEPGLLAMTCARSLEECRRLGRSS